MGMFKKKVKVTNSNNPKQFFEEEFWVDTGALYSFVPEDYLEKIGVEPSVSGCRSDTKEVKTDIGNHRWFLRVPMTIADR